MNFLCNDKLVSIDNNTVELNIIYIIYIIIRFIFQKTSDYFQVS